MWLSIRYHFSQNPLGLKLAFWGFLLITLLSVPVLSPGMDINMMSTGFLSPTYAGGALVPTFLLALYSGYVEFNSLERARRSAEAECVYTLLWLFSCALLGGLANQLGDSDLRSRLLPSVADDGLSTFRFAVLSQLLHAACCDRSRMLYASKLRSAMGVFIAFDDGDLCG